MTPFRDRLQGSLLRFGDRFWGTVEGVNKVLGDDGSIPELGSLEDQVHDALRPVRPSNSFRDHLRDNLSLAVEGKVGGLAYEYPRQHREGVILGITAGLFAAVVTALVLVFRSRQAGSKP